MKMKFSVRTLVHVALFIAIQVLLSRLCALINLPTVRISLGFVPIAICAMMFGPLWSGVTAGIADIIGAILVPTGSFFPPLTVSAILTGVVFGLFLYRPQGAPDRSSVGIWARICGAVAVNQVGISLFLNTLWLSILFGTAYGPLLVTRLIQTCVMVVLQVVALRLITKPITLYQKRQMA